MPPIEQILTSQSQKAPHRVESTQLFKEGARTVEIMHEDKKYILRITRQGKLILTK